MIYITENLQKEELISSLMDSIQKVKKLRMKPNKLTTEKIADPWKPFRSIAALLLWSTYD